MSDPSKLLEWLKNQSPVLFLALGLATGVLLFSPETFLQQIGMLGLVEQTRSWLGISFLVSVVGLVVTSAIALQQKISEANRRRSARAAQNQRFKELSPVERAYLAGYIAAETKTRSFQINDGVAQGLEHAGIIYRSTTVSSMFTYFAYNMQPWAWEYLNKNKRLLEPELTEEIQRRESE